MPYVDPFDSDPMSDIERLIVSESDEERASDVSDDRDSVGPCHDSGIIPAVHRRFILSKIDIDGVPAKDPPSDDDVDDEDDLVVSGLNDTSDDPSDSSVVIVVTTLLSEADAKNGRRRKWC